MSATLTIPDKLRPYTWAMEMFDFFGMDTDDNWREDMGPSPSARIIKRAELVLKRFYAIDWNNPDAGKDLNSAMMPLGSNAWPQFILTHYDEIPFSALRHVMPHAHSGWNLAMGGGPLIDYDDWAEVWRDVAYVTDGPDKPTEPIEVWTGNDIANGPWIDWTTDIEIARKFANMARPGEGVGIWHATVSPEAILGRLDGRGESEVIVDIELVSYELAEVWTKE